ncbi:substrate-binding domain-containing protein [Variovorax sp. LT1R16]|uniref:substrate-binding domain-containing protein n=1 Tax=Variovorax sp. LT1R16 TaxID=3443728 RepID=UPI003F46AB09
MHTKNQTEAQPWGRRLLAVAILSFSLASVGNAVAAAEIKIGGTGSALGAMRMVGEAFNKQHPDIRVVVLPSLGTSGAIKAVPKGQLDVGLSARPLSDDETKQGAVSVEYARTPLVFAVSPKSPIKALTLAQMADIYSGRMPEWTGGAKTRPILRQAGDDTTRQLRSMSKEMDAGLAIAEQRPGLPFATTDQEAADHAESIPGAIGVMTLSLILSEGRDLRALTLDGVDATVANATSGKYPHVKRCFVITGREPSVEARLFLSFLESSAGREVLMRTGHWVP